MKSNIKTRFASFVLAFAIIISLTATPAFASEGFYNKDPVSVGEAVEALYSLEGEPAMIKQIYDTSDETFATYEKNAMSWAYAYDIISTDDDMTANITQDKLAEFFYHYAKHHDVDVTASGQQSPTDWAESYGFIPNDSDLRTEEVITSKEFSTALSNYEASDLPKVGVIADGLSLIFPSVGQTTINPLCDFYVIGDIDPSVTVPSNALLTVQLKDSNGALMRDVFTNIKDNQQGMYVDYPGLVVAGGDREAFRNSMMPDIVYDPNFPESFGNTWMKACYTDEHYTSVIYGGAYHDDINPIDQFGRKLEPLPEGDYQLTVTIISGAETLASLSTQITIGTVPKKIISRFSPASYISKVREYASKNGYMVYEDPFAGTWSLPGFLPQWKMNYVGSIAKRWRLVDRMCYTGGMTYYFDYNTSATSVSYTVELGQIGYLHNLNDPNRITYVYWDIGEPEIKQQGKVYEGKFVQKSVSELEPVVFTRVDHSMTATPENTLNPQILNETTSVFDLSQQIEVVPGETVSLNGLCKVIQPDHVTLNDDGSITLGNKIAAIRYTLTHASGEVYQTVEKEVSLKRTFEDGSTSTSILEFRHNFTIEEKMRGDAVRIFAQALDEFGNEVGGQLYCCTLRVPRS